jgi:predicted SnoaL-like aldol condensation-catalyzing enzyme
LSVCDTLLSSDYVDHDAPSGAQGPESIREYVAKFLEDYPDLKLRIEDAVAESDKVVLRNTWTGQKVTGEDLHMTGIVILRFNEDGLIVERWSAYGG